jgi:MFS family permease
MFDTTRITFLKYLASGIIYFSEGLVFTIITVIVPVYLVEKNISLPVATLVAGIAGFPWIIKFLWGGMVDYLDKFGRKFFIITGGLLGAIGLFIAAFVDPFLALVPFTFILFITDICTGIFDVSADAWIIDISSKENRGKINGFILAGTFSGMIIGASIFGYIAEVYNYRFTFIVASLIVTLSMVLFFFLVKEEKRIEKKQKMSSLLLLEFKKKNTQLMTFFAPISTISNGLLIFAVPLYMKIILDLNIAQIGLITSLFIICKVSGSLFGGYFSDIFGRKKMSYMFMFGSIFFCGILVFADSWLILSIIYGFIGFLNGGYIANILAMFMDITNPKIGATQFSILASLMNIGETGIGTISGSLVLIIGFSGIFLYSAWVFCPAILILYFIKK